MAGVGETLVSAVVERVCGKLIDFLAEPLDLLWNLKDDMESMKSTMVTIQAVLSDAEKRSSRKEAESERLWLRRLKSAAYEIDDMLSDFEVSIPPKTSRRRDIIRQQAKLFFSSSNPLVSHITLAHNIKNMKEKLDKLVAERRDFDFKVDTSSDKLLEGLEIKNRETFSEIDFNHKTRIVGRDDEKEKIVNFLLQRGVGEDISTIPIVGLGGLGKTTLAQLVFNDENIETEFDIRAWVYVSMELDLLSMGKTILSQIDGRGQNYDSLQSVSPSLKGALADKRFLIVLDDIWEEDGQKLERLKLMLKGGKCGSKVIVTTCSKKVALLMSSKSAMVHYLKGLSDEDCWCIFSQRAFISGDEGNSALIEIGREIIKKCKGVPLAAKALGYILCSKEDIAAWSAVRDSEFWELNDDDVLPSLKLSYYHLPPQLKLCFAYCAIFPKGSDINRDKLVQQWIALEFIQETNGNFTPEKIGEEYVSILLGMSFLQYSPNYAENQNMFRMHDLVHDLARSVVGDEMAVLDARKKINRNTVNCDSYYSLLINYDNMEASADLNLLPDKIRALHFTNCASMLVHNKIFLPRKSLRVVNLSGCHVDKLPDSIYHLKQLRFLEVSLINTKSLPKSFGSLLNMEALDLSKSSLENIPISISNLEKLKNLSLRGCSLLRILPDSFSKLEFLTHLDLSDCCSLQLLPESFGNLSRLCFLHLSGCSELQKLPESIIDLKHLVHLDLSGCSSLKVLPELFGSLSSLQLLFLSGCSELKRLPESLGTIEGLQNLNLSDCRSLQELPVSFGNFCKLKSLNLSGCYELTNLPGSFSNLINLEHLNLSFCYKLHELPKCFGNLKYLKFLNLSSCFTLRNLPESFGSLLNVEKIDLSYCGNLEEFPESIATSDKLQMLDLRGCSNLIKFATTAENYVNSQERYDFQRLPEMFECKEIGQGGKVFSTIVRLEHLNQTRGKLHITCIENVHSSEEAESAKLCNKSKLLSLTLKWSSSTGESSEDAKKDELVLEKLQPHRNLVLFTLDGYRGTRLPGWVMGLESSLPNLTQITLCNLVHCEQIPPFGHLFNLEVLEIHNTPRLKRVETDLRLSRGSPRKLKIISLKDMPDLEEWSITGSANDVENTVATLEKLEIYRCPRVIFKPCLPSTGTSVIIESSMSLSQGGIASLSFKPRYSRYISNMYIKGCRITSDEWRGLSCFSKLEVLEINSCSELNCLPKGILWLTSLEYLYICDCNNLSVLPEWLGELTSLRSLWISRCQNLKSLPRSIQGLTGLESLRILNCGRDLVRCCLGEDKDIISHVRYVSIPEEIDPSETFDLSILSTSLDWEAMSISSDEIDLSVTLEEIDEMPSAPHLELPPVASSPNYLTKTASEEPNPYMQEPTQHTSVLLDQHCLKDRSWTMGKHWIPDSDPHHLNQKKEDENTDWDWYSETEGELKIHANHKSRHMFIPQMPPTGEKGESSSRLHQQGKILLEE